MSNPPLTTPPEPATANPDPLSLNLSHDDDGQAIDDYFESAYQGPPVASESEEYAALSIPETTRLIARTITIGTLDGVIADPVQILPSDPNRKSLHIDADGPIQITSDRMFFGATVVTYPWNDTTHTGAVWVYSTAAGAVTVSAWAVTT